MSGLRNILRKSAEFYRTLAVILLNTVLVFVVINLVIDGVGDLKEYLRRRSVERTEAAFGYSGWREPLAGIYPGLSKTEVDNLTRESRRVQLEYEPFTQFKEKACSGEYVNVDANGFRKVKDQGPWPISQAYYNIFLFGGSTSFGYRVADDQTIASHMQEILNRKSGQTVKVYNFGRLSYFSSQERILMEKLLIAGHIPQAVLFIDGLNDFAHPAGVPVFTHQLSAFMQESSESRLLKLLGELPIVKVFSCPPHGREISIRKDDTAVLLRAVLERYLRNKRTIEAIARDYGIKSFFVWQPVAVFQYDPQYNIFAGYDYASLTPYLQAGYEYAATTLKVNPPGDNFIWCADMQADVKEPLYADAYHYSNAMNKRIATFVVDAITARELP